MNANKFLTSEYLSVESVKEHNVWIVTEQEETLIDGIPKLVLILENMGLQKKFTLNQTNLNRLIIMFGIETDKWIGKKLEFTCPMMVFKGEEKLVIRIDERATRKQNNLL